MSWPTPIYGCLSGKDVDVNCCIQNVFCGPCTWSSALKAANVKSAEIIGISAVGGSIVGGESGEAIQSVAMLAGRRMLVKKYNINESLIQSILTRCFCSCCAQVQEINAVLVNEDMKYGCAQVEKDIVNAPSNNTMTRKTTKYKSRRDIQIS